MYCPKPWLPVNLYFSTQMAHMNTNASTKVTQQFYERSKWAYATAQIVIEKENQRHKQNSYHKKDSSKDNL